MEAVARRGKLYPPKKPHEFTAREFATAMEMSDTGAYQFLRRLERAKGCQSALRRHDGRNVRVFWSDELTEILGEEQEEGD